MLRSASGGAASRDWTPVLSRRTQAAAASPARPSSSTAAAKAAPAKAGARRSGVKRGKRGGGGGTRRAKTGSVKPGKPGKLGAGAAPDAERPGGLTQSTTTTTEADTVAAPAPVVEESSTTTPLEPLPGAHLQLPDGAKSVEQASAPQPTRPTQPRKPASKPTPRQRRRRRRKAKPKKNESQRVARRTDNAAAAAGLMVTSATAVSKLTTTINNKPVVLSKGSVTLTHLDRMGKDYPRLVFQASWRSAQERGQSMNLISRVVELDNGLSAERMDSLLTPQLKRHGKLPADPLAYRGTNPGPSTAAHDARRRQYGHQYIRHDAVRAEAPGDDDEEDRGEWEGAAAAEGETPQRFTSGDSGDSSLGLSSDSSFGFLDAEMARDSWQDIAGNGT